MKYLLGDDYNELERQEIYFSPLENLNDPMEGFLDLFWDGDDVVWKNFFRNYLRTLYWTVESALLGVEGESLKKNIVSTCRKVEFYTINAATLAVIEQKFIETKNIKELCKHLLTSARTSDEVIYYCELIHFEALSIIYKQLYKSGAVDYDAYNSFIKVLRPIQKSSYLNLLTFLQKKDEEHKGFERIACEIARKYRSQQMLIQECNAEQGKGTVQILLFGFPRTYVENLNLLVYPRGLVACFSKDVSNASLWGYYADSHSGAALKFKTKRDEDRISLLLRNRVGCSGRAGQDVVHHYDMVSNQFYEVIYKKKYPEVDFFRSLGALPAPEIESWLWDESGNCSACREAMKDIDSWRRRYWNTFYEIGTTKLEDWKHEDEYRLLLNETGFSYEKLDDRKLQYNFSDLEGIVFGIKTSNEDKLKAIEVINGKCQKEKRNDFKFYQAYYDRKTGLIGHDELTLLNRHIASLV
ncbi:hypothetical protein [Halodesulfovibrio aestuarii]|uniref:hypothetical protein n=1 Tax=Halodesulfovibrio aestuarii TaxID=126333 RepID=UPI003D3342BF